MPPPWTAEVTPNYFIVRDANGQALSYIYYESEPGRRSAAIRERCPHLATSFSRGIRLLLCGTFLTPCSPPFAVEHCSAKR